MDGKRVWKIRGEYTYLSPEEEKKHLKSLQASEKARANQAEARETTCPKSLTPTLESSSSVGDTTLLPNHIPGPLKSHRPGFLNTPNSVLGQPNSRKDAASASLPSPTDIATAARRANRKYRSVNSLSSTGTK